MKKASFLGAAKTVAAAASLQKKVGGLGSRQGSSQGGAPKSPGQTGQTNGRMLQKLTSAIGNIDIESLPQGTAGGIMDVPGHASRVRVAVRLRPFLPNELEADGSKPPAAVECAPEVNKVLIKKDQWNMEGYQFDAVFPEHTAQRRVYEEFALPVIAGVVEKGINGTIMAYGQTGTGKTHTMNNLGGNNDDTERGLLPRSLEHILNWAVEQNEKAPDSATVELSYVQIYLDTVLDLLAGSAIAKLDVAENPATGEVSLPGAVSRKITTNAEARGFLRLGEERRVVANQKMNAVSSRSHAILIVTVKLVRDTGMGQPSRRTSKLLLVDLAGSERVARSGVEGQQFEEAKAVNLSLTALGKCIQALTDPVPGHIPFRDNKLTRLLKDSFGGSARTSLIVCIGPTRESANETTSSLSFGTRALRVENSLKVREEVDFQVLCRRLQAQVDLMHREVEVSQDRAAQAEERMEEAETRMADLEVQQLAAAATLKTAKELEETLHELRDQVAEKQRKAEAAEAAAAAAKKEAQHLRDQEAKRQREKEKAVQEAAQLRGQLDEMSASLAETKDALVQSEEKYQRALVSHQQGVGSGAGPAGAVVGGASLEEQAEAQERLSRQEAEINYLVSQLREMEVTSALQRGAAVDRLLEHFVNIGTTIRRSGTARPLTETQVSARLLIAAQMAKYEFGLVGHDARAPPPDVPGIKDALLAALSDPSMVPSSRISVAPPDGAASGVSESFFGEPAGVSMTIGLLSYPDRDVRLHAVKVLANLAADETRQVMILQEGGLPALLSILTNGDEEAACRVAAGALANLAMDEANQEALVAAGAVQALVCLARTGRDPQTLRMVAGALANLCGNPAVEDALFEAGAVELLVEMSTSPNADVLAQVARGLGNCARSPAGRSYLLDIGGREPLERLAETTTSSLVKSHVEGALRHLQG